MTGVPHGSVRQPTALSRLVRRVLVAIYRWRGWSVEGGHPGIDKFIITGAPHTSNWDFVFFIGVADSIGIRPSFVGKHTLFRWPMKRFMRDMGGISVDRSRRGSNNVEQVAQAFSAADTMALVMAPEGSRSGTGEWRTGVWHMARAAGVPIVPAWVDHRTMKGGIGTPVWPTDDIGADLSRIAAFYLSKMPDCPRFLNLADQARMLASKA